MATSNPFSFQLPNSQAVEVVFVRLPDGSIVARTPQELAALPDDLLSQLVFLQPQQ